ncbi:MAG: Smr/MutS family protein [Deltaproteobacteria bacterium]|nr:Smr/MutS family protein [Deltaproteobacteria bacterium]
MTVLISKFHISASTRKQIGFDVIVAVLAERTSTSRGRELALEHQFFTDRDQVQLSLTRIEQVREILREEKILPVSGATDIRPFATRAAKGAILNGEELRACHGLMRTAMDVRSFLRLRRETMPELAAISTGISDFAALANRIDYMLEPSGRVRDEASETLAAYRRRARNLHSEARRRIDTMLADQNFTPYLQDRYFSIRSERYVLPVNASFRSSVPGIVHNASQTGQTLFIEPQALVDLGNELAIAESLIAEEEQRILQELSASVGDRENDLDHAVDSIGTIDFIQASAHLANDLDANAPELADATADIDLRQMRHPVLALQGKSVVANDVFLRTPTQALIVSGPNAGGKTVSIAAVGLCSLMVRAGLPIPVAAGSRMPLFYGVTSIIGDEQDLKRGLSTFSAHLSAIAEAMQQAGFGWLVLIDEIAADTDPTQGAALARAILEQLLDAGTRVLATTHLDEVKALGITDTRFINARVGLDPISLAPTYRLEIGAAGVSSAIEMAERVGLPTNVISRAREYLRGEGLLAAALTHLEVAEREVETERQELAAQREATAKTQQQLEASKNELEQARRDLKLQINDELLKELEDRRSQATKMIAELQAKASISGAQKAQQRLEELANEVKYDIAKLQAETDVGESAQALVPTEEIDVGTWVKVVSLDKEGRVIKLAGKSAIVEIGTLNTRVKLKDLVGLVQKSKQSQSDHRRLAKAESKLSESIVEGSSDTRCDIRGMRTDEAMSEVERFLDQRYLYGPTRIVIVHGHGSGILKQMVREALEKSPYVASSRPGDRYEGGDGVTVVEIVSA